MATAAASLHHPHCAVPFATATASATRLNNHLPMMRQGRSGFPCIRFRRLHFQICDANAETVKQVSDIVRKQLALAPEVQVTPDSTFAELGADSLDTVEIVMGLEEAFEITVEEENSDNITTIKDAADLIDKILENKPASPSASPST
ncbi:acyl carrier protein 4, chloroplastic-like [Andrographis paniculata]|uniref:acyl carrier protein 4, chloroplastic-like n=1 Tax=Andrographis paniculata TaxID=175694 RepID=UPI0021E97828|nr:acyl carrier protein 4, chloroplastic-like [Andrographis paniculata]